MGRKGSWFSAIKRVFVPSSKEKSTDGLEKKSGKEKKKSRGILRHGENKSFIPMFREPSSIEKILGEADEEKLFFRPTIPSEQPQTPTILLSRPASPRVATPKAASPPRAASSRPSPPRAASSRPSPPILASSRPRASSPRVSSPKASSPRETQYDKEISYIYRPEATSRNQHLSATMIQSAYRGYIARRSYRALRGLVRLQGVIRGQNVKRQTMNAMKQMQLLVKVQTQIQSRRIQMSTQRQAYTNDKDVESTLSKWTYNQLVDGTNEDWDDSVLTKEQREARMQQKVEAVIKRERAMAYAYSHQMGKPSPTAQSALDVRSTGAIPWWWNWLERQLLPANASEQSERPTKNFHLTPPRSISGHKPSPRLHTSSFKPINYGYDNHEALTPTSSKSTIPTRTKQFHTPSRTPPGSSSSPMKYSRPRASAVDSRFDISMKDDDSLTSCPPFSVPNYMQPTVSAKAKTRANSNPKERIPGTPGSDSKRRFSFPLTPNIGSFKWNKGSNSKDSTSQRVFEKHQSHQSLQSVGEVSIDSAVSMPAAFGRRPFNRFV